MSALPEENLSENHPDIKLTWHKLGMLQNAALFGWTTAKPKGAQHEFKELEKFLAAIGAALRDKKRAVIDLLEERVGKNP